MCELLSIARFRDELVETAEEGKFNVSASMKNEEQKTELEPARKAFQKKKLSRVFSEDYEAVQRNIFDPRGTSLSLWNKLFLLACLASLFVDPLFFYLPSIDEDEMCLAASHPLEIVLTVTRSAIDAFYVIQIFVRFRTAYVAPSSRVYGRGELVIDSKRIASRYFSKDLWFDLLAALPLPQVHYFISSFQDLAPGPNS